MSKQQIVNVSAQEKEDNPMYCYVCSHEAKRHTTIGCDHVTAATRRYGLKNVVSVDFCDCSLTFEEVLK
jgi:hypothetical protein